MAIKVGDTVGLKAAFLKSIGGHELARDRGVVCRIKGRVAYVDWQHADEPKPVLICNLARVGTVSWADASASPTHWPPSKQEHVT